VEYLIAYLLSLILLLTIIAFTTLQIRYFLIRDGKNEYMETNTRAWFGLINLKLKVPLVKLADNLKGTKVHVELESPNEEIQEIKVKITPKRFYRILKQILSFIKRVHDLLKILKIFLKRVRLEQFEWKTKIGTGDAAETGMLAGASWGMKGSIVGMIGSMVSLRTLPTIYVHPLFNEKKITTTLSCMFRFRIGYAMVAGIRIVLNLRKKA
jgi:hypothetical protein